jgi:ribosomal 50S subunit-recycling heat shock protein
MRLDKFLKLSRVIKRRTVANDVCQAGRVMVNGRQAKPSVQLKVGDEVSIFFGSGEVRFKVTSLPETVRKEEAASMYELLE